MLLNYKDTGTGPLIVLLHGMAGSHRYWNNFLPYISKGNRVITIDLLGFGQSPMPRDNAYDYVSHMQSIKETLASAGASKDFTLVGHSMGALIALRYAVTFPVHVNKLALVGMPVYDSPESARKSLTGGSKLKNMVYYGVTSRMLCYLWCKFLRPISRRAAPTYLPHLTIETAEDSVFHTWLSYSRSLKNIIENQSVANDLSGVKCPTLLLYGTDDVPNHLLGLNHILQRSNLQIITSKGSHQIANEKPDILANWLVG